MNMEFHSNFKYLIANNTHDILVGFVVEAFSEHRHDEDVDEEGQSQCERGLNKEIEISFRYFAVLGSVDASCLENINNILS